MPCLNIRVRAHRRKGTKGVKAHGRIGKLKVGDHVLLKSGLTGRITDITYSGARFPIQIVRDVDGYEYYYPEHAIVKILR